VTATVRRHRARSFKMFYTVGAVVTVAVWGAAVLALPPPTWRPAEAGPHQVAQTRLEGPPTWLRIAKIGVDSALVPLHLDSGGSLEVPKDYRTPGWYAEGTAPGDIGPAVIAGHVDSVAAPAVFYRLGDLRPDDAVQVQRDGRWVKFRVVSTGRYPKGHFPTAEVYGPTPDAQLRLITCGGSFDRARNSYRDNVVVFAIMESDG
jgi:hypothetical protein